MLLDVFSLEFVPERNGVRKSFLYGAPPAGTVEPLVSHFDANRDDVTLLRNRISLGFVIESSWMVEA